MFTKLIRIGRDAEMKYLPSGTAILEFSAVYDIGFGDKKKAQWVKVAMFGQRAEKLVAHFTKGKLIVASMDDVKSEAWIKDGEAKSGLSAKLVEFEFAGGQSDAPQQPAFPANQPPSPQGFKQAPQQQAPQQGFSSQSPAQQQGTYQAQQQKQTDFQQAPSIDFDDDIPF